MTQRWWDINSKNWSETEIEAGWVHISKEFIIIVKQQCSFISCLPWPKTRVGKGKKSHSKMEKNGNYHRKCSAANSCALWACVWHGQATIVVRNWAELVWLWNGNTKTWDSLCSWRLAHSIHFLQFKLAAPVTAFGICLVSFCVLTLNSISVISMIWVSPAGQHNV